MSAASAVVAAASLLSATLPASSAAVQSLDNDLRFPVFEGAKAAVRIQTFQEAPYHNFEVTLYGPDHCYQAPTLDACLALPLSAIRTDENQAPRVARSATCPALANIFRALIDLPAQSAAPDFSDFGNRVRPIPPTKKDGASHRITVAAKAPDGNTLTVTFSDYSGPYAHWADTSLVQLRQCWSPMN